MTRPNAEPIRPRHAAHDETPPISSKDCLLRVNHAIYDAISAYVGDAVSRPDLLFDIPKDGQVDKATVSVFLYDIHEDLQLRHGENRMFDRSRGESTPCVHSRFCYLVTCWTAEQGSPPFSDGYSDAMLLANQVFNALINLRTLPGLPQAYCRVLPPTEQLNSLGTFWQALGNRPRLCMTYMVSLPVPLSSPLERVPDVAHVQVHLDATPAGGTPAAPDAPAAARSEET
ncbi:MAG: Pvc16 family protein [Janthinobacterium lividum]